MKELIKINGTRKINGKEIKVIEGGFGEGCKILTDKQIAEIHNIEPKHVRETINRNIKRFKNGIDFIDLKGVDVVDTLLELGYHKASVTQAKNIYALSERGYSKLIKIMDTDLAWEIHDELIDNYFTMRKIINSDEQLKANLLLSIYNGGQEGVLASRQLTEIEVKQATAPLIAEVEHKEDVIIGLVEDIDLAEKRQRISQIIRHNAKGRFQERYKLLYEEFNKKYHIDAKRRMENGKERGEVKKSTNLMGYICDYMNKTAELYEIACKLFENDFEQLKKEMWEVVA